MDEDVRLELKGMLPFDPIRKIMSVVVMTDDGEYLMFAKGADSGMLKRCSGLSPKKLTNIQNKVNKFAEKSLRTLIMGMKIFD